MIEKTTCYVAYCDKCKKPEEHDYIPHRPSEDEAEAELQQDGWFVWEGHHWHEWCLPKCKCGHLFGIHDYGEAPCEDCDCKGFNPEEQDESGDRIPDPAPGIPTDSNSKSED